MGWSCSRGDNLLQVIEFNKQLKSKIIELENESTIICKKLEQQYREEFQKLGTEITVECLRTLKGQLTEQINVFEEHYESFVEIGIEEDDEYFPNAHIPIWKCKKEMFQQIGYLTKNSSSALENKMNCMIQEILHEKLTEINP